MPLAQHLSWFHQQATIEFHLAPSDISGGVIGIGSIPWLFKNSKEAAFLKPLLQGG